MIRKSILSSQNEKEQVKQPFGLSACSSCLFSHVLIYFFSHLSSHSKKVRCHSTPFCGCNTQ